MSMPGALQGLRCRIIATREPRMADSFAAQLADALEASWPAIARPNQLPPPGDWQVWLLLAGRGFGKTRTLAEWVCQQAASGRAGRIALVAATAADARDVLVEGQSGILAVSPHTLAHGRHPKRPNRERECLVGERTRIVNRIKSTLARLG